MVNTMNNSNPTTLKELTLDEIEAVSGAGLVTNLLGTVGSLVGLKDPLVKIGTGVNETLNGTIDSLGLGVLKGVVDTLI